MIGTDGEIESGKSVLSVRLDDDDDDDYINLVILVDFDTNKWYVYYISYELLLYIFVLFIAKVTLGFTCNEIANLPFFLK